LLRRSGDNPVEEIANDPASQPPEYGNVQQVVQ
jgi:hypothetical protein